MTQRQPLEHSTPDAELAEALVRTVHQLKEEHAELQQVLQQILAQISILLIQLSEDEAATRSSFDVLLQQTQVFMAQLEAHELWEEREAFPIFAGLAHRGLEPGFTTAEWIIEEDHKQAGRMLRGFLEQAGAQAEPDRASIVKAITLLDVACSVLTEHLQSEGELLFPIAERLLRQLTEQQD